MQVPNVMAIERRKSKWQLRLALEANADDVDFLAPPSFTPVQLSSYRLGEILPSALLQTRLR